MAEKLYVDDALKSVNTTKIAIKLIKNIDGMCEAGGFNLTKFVSTENKVLESLPVSKISHQVHGCDLSKGSILLKGPLGFCGVSRTTLFNSELLLTESP